MKRTTTMRSILAMILVCTVSFAFAQSKQPAPSQEKYRSNIDELTLQIESDPTNTDLYVKIADQTYLLNAIYRAQADEKYKLKKVVEYIDKAIEVSDSDPHLYSLRGNYKKLIYGDKAGAIQDLTKAIELNPNNPDWYFQRANYRSVEEACEDWKYCSDLGDYRCVKIYEQLCVNTGTP